MRPSFRTITVNSAILIKVCGVIEQLWRLLCILKLSTDFDPFSRTFIDKHTKRHIPFSITDTWSVIKEKGWYATWGQQQYIWALLQILSKRSSLFATWLQGTGYNWCIFTYFSRLQICEFISIFSLEKKGFDISCKFSPLETICMKCRILFSEQIREYFKMLSAENFPRN